MTYFKHPSAIVESQNIGSGTSIWAFSHILPGAKIGQECNICDHTFVENDVVVGNRVMQFAPGYEELKKAIEDARKKG